MYPCAGPRNFFLENRRFLEKFFNNFTENLSPFWNRFHSLGPRGNCKRQFFFRLVLARAPQNITCTRLRKSMRRHCPGGISKSFNNSIGSDIGVEAEYIYKIPLFISCEFFYYPPLNSPLLLYSFDNPAHIQ